MVDPGFCSDAAERVWCFCCLFSTHRTTREQRFSAIANKSNQLLVTSGSGIELSLKRLSNLRAAHLNGIFFNCPNLFSTALSESSIRLNHVCAMFELDGISIRTFVDASDDDNNRYLIPSAMQDNAWQLWLLSMLYLLIGVVALAGFVQSVRFKGTYFRASFLCVSSGMCLMRGLLTLISYSNWQQHMFWLYLLNLFLPVYLQFWTFSLLVLFVRKCLYIIADQEIKIHSWTFYPLFHFVQGVLFTVCVIVSYELSRTYHSADADTWDREPTLYVAILYGLLSLFGTVYSYKCYQMLAIAAPSADRKRQLRKFYVLIPMYLTLFALRSSWNLLYYAGANPAQDMISRFIRDQEETKFNWAFLAFYSIVEVIPSGVVVYIFTSSLICRRTASVPDGGAGKVRACAYSCCSALFRLIWCD